jgi:transposase, IS5 family
MAIDLSGLDGVPKEGIIQVMIEESNSLVRLAKALPWQSLCDLVVEDLKKTAAKGMWQKGRKIVVRNQLAVYLLQRLYNLPDRKIEQGIKDNAAYQVFCGKQFLQTCREINPLFIVVVAQGLHHI